MKISEPKTKSLTKQMVPYLKNTLTGPGSFFLPFLPGYVHYLLLLDPLLLDLLLLDLLLLDLLLLNLLLLDLLLLGLLAPFLAVLGPPQRLLG